jgi:hypothetical protein
MNTGKIVRTFKGIYLKVEGNPLVKPAYFEIVTYATEEIIKNEVSLSKKFDIDLQTKEE